MKNCTPLWREAHFQVTFTFTFMSCALHAHKGNSAHLSRYRTKIKMKNEYGATKPLRRSQGQDGKLQPKILLRQNHQKSQWQLRLLIRLRKYFSAAWESDLTSLFLKSSFHLLGMRSCVSSRCVQIAVRQR